MIRKRRLNRPALKMIVSTIFGTRKGEIDCDRCLAELDSFTERILEGKELSEAQLLVQDHLSRCGECREEYELLLQALKRLESNGEA
jgi:hypothetical protein